MTKGRRKLLPSVYMEAASTSVLRQMCRVELVSCPILSSLKTSYAIRSGRGPRSLNKGDNDECDVPHRGALGQDLVHRAAVEEHMP